MVKSRKVLAMLVALTMVLTIVPMFGAIGVSAADLEITISVSGRNQVETAVTEALGGINFNDVRKLTIIGEDGSDLAAGDGIFITGLPNVEEIVLVGVGSIQAGGFENATVRSLTIDGGPLGLYPEASINAFRNTTFSELVIRNIGQLSGGAGLRDANVETLVLEGISDIANDFMTGSVGGTNSVTNLIIDGGVGGVYPTMTATSFRGITIDTVTIRNVDNVLALGLRDATIDTVIFENVAAVASDFMTGTVGGTNALPNLIIDGGVSGVYPIMSSTAFRGLAIENVIIQNVDNVTGAGWSGHNVSTMTLLGVGAVTADFMTGTVGGTNTLPNLIIDGGVGGVYPTMSAHSFRGLTIDTVAFRNITNIPLTSGFNDANVTSMTLSEVTSVWTTAFVNMNNAILGTRIRVYLEAGSEHLDTWFNNRGFYVVGFSDDPYYTENGDCDCNDCADCAEVTFTATGLPTGVTFADGTLTVAYDADVTAPIVIDAVLTGWDADNKTATYSNADVATATWASPLEITLGTETGNSVISLVNGGEVVETVSVVVEAEAGALPTGSENVQFLIVNRDGTAVTGDLTPGGEYSLRVFAYDFDVRTTGFHAGTLAATDVIEIDGVRLNTDIAGINRPWADWDTDYSVSTGVVFIPSPSDFPVMTYVMSVDFTVVGDDMTNAVLFTRTGGEYRVVDYDDERGGRTVPIIIAPIPTANIEEGEVPPPPPPVGISFDITGTAILMGIDVGGAFDDAGIRVELVDRTDIRNSLLDTLTAANGTFTLQVRGLDIDLEEEYDDAPRYMLRFSRIGTNGGVHRNASYLNSILYLDGTDLVILEVAEEADPVSSFAAPIVRLFPGAFEAPGIDKERINAVDHNIMRRVIGDDTISVDDAETTIFDINGDGFVSPGDYVIVRNFGTPTIRENGVDGVWVMVP